MTSKSQHLQIRVTPAQKKRLRRLADAAGQDLSGYVLSRVLPSNQKRFEELLELLAEVESPRFVLAELNDLLSGLVAEELQEAVSAADPRTLTPFVQNYVAAMVEQACSMMGVLPPAWTTRIKPLDKPHFAAPLRSVRLHLLKSSPVVFKRRNLFIDAGIGARV